MGKKWNENFGILSDKKEIFGKIFLAFMNFYIF